MSRIVCLARAEHLKFGLDFDKNKSILFEGFPLRKSRFYKAEEKQDQPWRHKWTSFTSSHAFWHFSAFLRVWSINDKWAVHNTYIYKIHEISWWVPFHSESISWRHMASYMTAYLLIHHFSYIIIAVLSLLFRPSANILNADEFDYDHVYVC